MLPGRVSSSRRGGEAVVVTSWAWMGYGNAKRDRIAVVAKTKFLNRLRTHPPASLSRLDVPSGLLLGSVLVRKASRTDLDCFLLGSVLDVVGRLNFIY